MSSSAGILRDRSFTCHLFRRDTSSPRVIDVPLRPRSRRNRYATRSSVNSQGDWSMSASVSAVRGGWCCGCPGQSTARFPHGPTDGVDVRARCPLQLWTAAAAPMLPFVRRRLLKGISQLTQDVFSRRRRLHAGVPLHSRNFVRKKILHIIVVWNYHILQLGLKAATPVLHRNSQRVFHFAIY